MKPTNSPPQEHVEFDAEHDRVERRNAVLVTFAWLMVLPLLVIAALHLVAHDATAELIALNAFTQWLYTPAWLSMLIGLKLRRRAIVLCAGVVVCAHVAWLNPSSLMAAQAPAWVAQGHHLRVMSANLLLVNHDTDGIAQEIRAARPDLLLVQELTPEWASRFDSAELRALLPHRTTVVRDDAFGIGLYSRLPLQTETFDLLGIPALRAQVRLGTRDLTVYNVHTLPPRTRAYAAKWNRMMAALTERLDRERGSLLVGGDLNATPYTRWYRTLVSSRLRGAHEDRGRGLATTWPNGLMPYPPIRLDHVLVSREVAVLDVREGEGRGSDHRPVIADIALPR